ncbi:MAG: hypothetical protein ABR903_03910 [Thermodesulfovibrionales bacterium]
MKLPDARPHLPLQTTRPGSNSSTFTQLNHSKQLPKRYSVNQAALFGLVLRGEDRPGNDVAIPIGIEREDMI